MFKLTIEEKKSHHLMDRKPRYSVKVNGSDVGELYFNMGGYCGKLMTPQGQNVDIGEEEISTWKREASRINKEASDLFARNQASSQKLKEWRAVMNGRFVRANFEGAAGDVTSLIVRRKELRAALELLPMGKISPEMFDIDDVYQDMSLLTALAAQRPLQDEDWSDLEMTLAVFETEDPDLIAVSIGGVSCGTGAVIDAGEYDHRMTCDDLAKGFEISWHRQTTRIVFLPKDDFEDMKAAVGGDFMRSSLLTDGDWGAPSRIFAPLITSERQRPDLLLTEDQKKHISGVIDFIGLSWRQKEPEACEGLAFDV